MSSSPEVRLEIDGKVFTGWTSAHLTRNLAEICGSFELEYDDGLRARHAMPYMAARNDLFLIATAMPARILLDGELVLVGWIEDVDFELNGSDVRARISGRDRAGWLVDCSANPNGPAEYKSLTAVEIASRLCAPFEIPVRAEVDVGAPLRDFGIELGESVMSAIEKAARQRAVLVTSDGIGNLVLTRSGNRRSPAGLTQPGNVLHYAERSSIREVYSDYYVKGQHRPDRGGRKARLDGTAMPLTARQSDDDDTAEQSRRAVASPGPADGTAYPIGQSPPLATQSPAQTQRSSIISSGHARGLYSKVNAQYRPRVFTVRSQAGDASNQILAEWRSRIADGRSIHTNWKVAGWRAGDDDRLWRPNEIVSVKIGKSDPHDDLISSVRYSQTPGEGSLTEMETVGVHAFDLEPLADQHRHNGVARGSNVGNNNLGRTPGGTSRR